MTSKERVRAAIAHKQPDKVPATMQCVQTAWEKMMKHFGVNTIDEVQDILEIDTRIMDLPPYIGPEHPAYTNELGELVKTHPLGYQYVDKWNGVEYNWHTVKRPMEIIKSMENFLAFDNWPNPDHFDYQAIAAFCGKHEDKAIRVGWPGPYQVFLELFPAQPFYEMMVVEPDLVKAMLNRFMEFNLELYERMFQAGDGRIDILRTCDDYGTQISLLFSVDMWREFFAENTRRLVELSHRYNCYFMQHSCGAIRPIIPELIACGVDILEPLQKVRGLEPEGLKRDFGDQIAFQGGVDTQKLLPLGTPEQVKKETEEVIRALHVDGGYILAPSQDFEGDVPVENILALYEARKSFA